MDDLTEAIADFIRARQLNIAVAVLMTLAYLMYQYRDTLFKWQEENECLTRRQSARLSRSRSRSRSSAKDRDYRLAHSKTGRRGRKSQRCPNCNSYDYDE